MSQYSKDDHITQTIELMSEIPAMKLGSISQSMSIQSYSWGALTVAKYWPNSGRCIWYYHGTTFDKLILRAQFLTKYLDSFHIYFISCIRFCVWIYNEFNLNINDAMDDGNLLLRWLEKFVALSYTFWKLNYKFPRQFVKLWMSLSQHRQQHYLAWYYQNKFKLQPTRQNPGSLTDLIFVRLNISYYPST